MPSHRLPFWSPSVYARRRPFLMVRGRVATALRAWFAAQDFIEVETSALQTSPGNETHLHAFRTELIAPSGEHDIVYLRTSPEFACKKLLSAGEPRIYDFARVFRNRERGPLHHPEFTLLEWYRANESYERLMDDCAALLAEAADAAASKSFRYRGREMDPFATPERVTVAAAFDRYAGIDLMATISGEKGDRARLAAAANAAAVRTAEDDSWGDIFSRILVDKIEPQLGIGRATILYEYPITQAALARSKAGDPKVAERFELYGCGVELANAFGELNDVDEQRRRFNAAMDEKQRIYGERYPVDEDFLGALSQMPQASGTALGFDRLAMLATGADHIEQVLWTPVVDRS